MRVTKNNVSLNFLRRLSKVLILLQNKVTFLTISKFFTRTKNFCINISYITLVSTLLLKKDWKSADGASSCKKCSLRHLLWINMICIQYFNFKVDGAWLLSCLLLPFIIIYFTNLFLCSGLVMHFERYHSGYYVKVW